MTSPRVRPGGRRELGLTNWVLSRLASRSVGVPHANLFATLGRTGTVFRGWLHYSATMMPFGQVSPRDTEMIIIRVAHVRGCAYELEHHLRLGRGRGVTDELAGHLVARPVLGRNAAETVSVPDISRRDDAILDAVDELVTTGDLSDENWRGLRRHFDEAQVIEILLLIGHYGALASVIAALRIDRDPPP